MRKVRRWRYYCDFCKKGGGQGAAITKHERTCTMNPNRGCGLCEHAGQSQPDIDVLTKVINEFCNNLPPCGLDGYCPSGKELDPMIEELDELANNCPACILAALRQAKRKTWSDFDFKAKLAAWWIDENAAHDNERYY